MNCRQLIPWVPAIAWTGAYRREWLPLDVAAGLTAAAVVIPKAMAYASVTTTTSAILAAAALGEVAGPDSGVALATAIATLSILVGLMLVGKAWPRAPSASSAIPRVHTFEFRWALPRVLIVRIVGRVYFANAQNIGDKLRELLDAANPAVLILDCSAIQDFEYTALKGLIDFETELRGRGIRLVIAALNPVAKQAIRRTPLGDILADAGLFSTVEAAVARWTP